MAPNPKIRIQLLLDESQKDYLEWTANNQGISLSALIRKIVDQYQHAETNAQLARAAEELYPEYLSDDELTVFTSMDGRTSYEAGRSVEDNS